ncbi:hypothetical protein [Novosphingobium cyanobacteriorum]|uniref:Uncharacterized protein n=1 Tax=Novosphingobium cyanobacteriorum TaxID=3024215 RepID=A0ABT6CMF5_9SPHN|nr:hypothetical protein [Novosphingobium cyanobacteriorum]MDF8335096.1 hypothetical protein [Novosphingobium cyanobacteriorum]
MNRHAARVPATVLSMPLALALLSIGGLVIGLTGDGWRDALCSGALALPLALFLFHFLRRGTPPSRSNQKDRP